MPPGILHNGQGYYALLAEDLLATEHIYDKFCQGIFFSKYQKEKDSMKIH